MSDSNMSDGYGDCRECQYYEKREHSYIEQIKSLQAELDQIKDIYIPGLQRCAKCGFRQISSTLNATSGAVTARNTSDPCPNGCGPLWKVTYKDDYQSGDETIERLYGIVDEREEEVKNLQAELDQQKNDYKYVTDLINVYQSEIGMLNAEHTKIPMLDDLRNQLDQSQWVDCDDRLPEEGNWVLAVSADHVRVLFFDGVNESGIHWLEEGDWDLTVTHWQPLPPLPSSTGVKS